MPYTQEDALREMGGSEDWPVGLEVSIKKWEHRVRGDVDSYIREDFCGLCFVKRDKGVPCSKCPAQPICRSLSDGPSDKEVLQSLKNLRKEPKMDCSKVCANFKPKKGESPFPEGLKTKDLKVGMVVRKGNINSFIFTILEPPGDVCVRVLRAGFGCSPRETKFYLADKGCQPYKSGMWNPSNWLREVK